MTPDRGEPASTSVRRPVWGVVPWAGALGGLILVAAGWLLVDDFVIDDAYITFRYAENLARHHALYYNVGEHGRFGYTNPGYLFLLSALHTLWPGSLTYEALARLLACLGLGFFGCVVVERLRRRLGGIALTVWSAATLLLLLVFPYALPNFFSGLETPLVAVALYLIFQPRFGPAPTPGSPTSVVGLAMALTLRSDFLPLLSPIVVSEAWAALKRRRARSLVALSGALAAGVLVASLNVALTGYVVPLSFGHKWTPSAYGATLLEYVVLSLGVLGALVVGAPLVCGKQVAVRPGVLAYYGFVIAFYSLFTKWSFYRYVFPFLFALFLIGLLAVVEQAAARRPVRLGLLYAVLGVSFVLTLPDSYQWVSGYRVSGLPALTDIADAMRASRIPGDDRVLATYDAGYVPFRSGWALIDLQGLTTAEVRRERIGDVIARRQPTILIVSTWKRLDASAVRLSSQYQRGQDPVPASYRLLKHVPLTNRYWWPRSEYGYYIFANEKASPELTRAIEAATVDPESRIGRQRYVVRLVNALPVGGQGPR